MGRAVRGHTRNMEAAVRLLLRGIGEDIFREGLAGTPGRVTRALLEMTAGYEENPADLLSTRFTSKSYDEMVVVRGIEFWSLWVTCHRAGALSACPNSLASSIASRADFRFRSA